MLQNHWCVTVSKSSVAIFVSQAEMQLCQVNKNQTALELIWGFDLILWGPDAYAWGQGQFQGMCDLQKTR